MKVPVISIVAGLVMAGIVHIAVILLVPVLASQDAWSKLLVTGPEWQFARLNSSKSAHANLLSEIDPLFQISACRYSLSSGSLRVRSNGNLPYWSVAVFDRYGGIIYSFNNRTAIDQKLNLLVVTPLQMSQLRQNPPESIEQAIVVEADINRGFVLIRALQSDLTWAPAVDNFLGEASCENLASN